MTGGNYIFSASPQVSVYTLSKYILILKFQVINNSVGLHLPFA